MSETSVQESLRHLRNHHLRKCTLELVRKKISCLLLLLPFVTKFGLFLSSADDQKIVVNIMPSRNSVVFVLAYFCLFVVVVFRLRLAVDLHTSRLLTYSLGRMKKSRFHESSFCKTLSGPQLKKNSSIFADKLTTD